VSGEPMQPACEIVAISRHSFYIGPWVKCLKMFYCESSLEASVVKSVGILLKDDLIRNLKKKTASKSDKK
jgi:hypothetical protein